MQYYISDSFDNFYKNRAIYSYKYDSFFDSNLDRELFFYGTQQFLLLFVDKFDKKIINILNEKKCKIALFISGEIFTKNIPDYIYELKNLEILHICCNGLDNLNLKNLQNLKQLNVSNNFINTIPDYLLNLTNLEVVIMILMSFQK